MIKIDLEKNIASIQINGTPTYLELKEYIDAILTHPDHRDGMDEIWDFSNASLLSLYEKELRILAVFVEERLPKIAKRVAYVIADDVDYGIGRMWMVYAVKSDAHQERKLFRTMEEAIDWLASPAKNTD